MRAERRSIVSVAVIAVITVALGVFMLSGRVPHTLGGPVGPLPHATGPSRDMPAVPSNEP
jgi:hypothetical protein